MISLMLKHFSTIFEDVEKSKRNFNQLNEIENITEFYKLEQKVIKFSNDYFTIVHKAAFDVKHRKRLKI